MPQRNMERDVISDGSPALFRWLAAVLTCVVAMRVCDAVLCFVLGGCELGDRAVVVDRRMPADNRASVDIRAMEERVALIDDVTLVDVKNNE